jgi:hypothetical protein
VVDADEVGLHGHHGVDVFAGAWALVEKRGSLAEATSFPATRG